MARLRRRAAPVPGGPRGRDGDLATVFVLGVAVAVGSRLFNCAAVVHRGRVLGLVPKEKLPTYNVFYEGRTFSRGGPGLSLDADGIPLGDFIFEFDFGTVAAEVCEDAWSPDGPMRRRSFSGAEVVTNVSASPYRMGIDSTRREMLATRAADSQYGAAVRQRGRRSGRSGLRRRRVRLPERPPRAARRPASPKVGGPRSSISIARAGCESRTRRGASMATSSCWRTPRARDRAAPRRAIARCSTTPLPTAAASSCRPVVPRGLDPRDRALDDLFEALALGVKSYYEKTGAFRSLGLALSGGRDSMLTLLVAWRAAQLIEPGPTRDRRVLHAEPALAGRHPRRRGTARPRAGHSRSAWSRSTRPPIANRGRQDDAGRPRRRS